MRDLRFEELYCATRLREGKVVRSTKRGVRDLRFEEAVVELCCPLSAVRFPREGRQSDNQTSDYFGVPQGFAQPLPEEGA